MGWLLEFFDLNYVIEVFVRFATFERILVYGIQIR